MMFIPGSLCVSGFRDPDQVTRGTGDAQVRCLAEVENGGAVGAPKL